MLKRFLSNLLPIAVISIILGGILNLVYPVADYIPDRLTDLTYDVNVTSPSDSQLLTYNGTSSKWENKANAGLSTALTSGKIFVGNASDIATGVTMTGDVNITNAGVTAVTDDSHAHTGTTLSSIDISADTNLAVTSPVILTGDNVSIQQSNSTQSGYLSDTDWSTFNNKVATTRTISTTSPLSGGGDLSADRTLVIQAANATQAGALSSADWTTFNNKQAALGFTPENSANKGVASGYASLNASALVVENPVNATSTATASKIPIADGSGKLDTWITLGTSVTESELSLSDITTGDFNTTQHGFTPKGTNLGKYLKDDGTWGTPSGTGAPTDATYITQTTNVSLSAEQALGALATGILKSTTTTGVVSIAAQGTDYYAPAGTDVAVADGGTGKSSWTQYLIPYADTTTSFSQIAIGSSGQVLTSNGAGLAPTFQAASGGANTALSNLASVAINLGLVSDTDNTDDLGTEAIHWKDLYLSGDIKSGSTGAVITGGKGADDQYTKLLLHFNGADASTTFTDETGKTATVAGNAQIDTAQSKFGGASGLFDGTGDNINFADSNDWNFGTSDFTIDFWIRFNSAIDCNPISQFVDGSNYWLVLIYITDGKLYFYGKDAGTSIGYFSTTNAQTWNANTWYHIEIARSGSSCYMFKDGTSLAVTVTTAWGTLPDLAAPLYIGDRSDGGNGVNGWIEEVRVSKNIARHTGSFTVKAKEYGGTLQTGNVYVDNLLGIGTASPTTPLYVLANDDATAATVKINAAQASVTASDTFIDFRSTTGSEGSIAGTASAGVLAYNTFTGSHFTQIIDKTGLEPNMLLEIVDESITDFPQPVRIKEEEEVEKDINGKPIIIGTDIENPSGRKGNVYKKRKVIKTEVLPYKASAKGQLFKSRICQTKGSQSAVGVYLGTDKEGRDMIGSIGTGFIWVANKGKNINTGDYLISSDVLGCVELQPDGIYRNTTVAKSTESIKWKQDEARRLIRCVYLGG